MGEKFDVYCQQTKELFFTLPEFPTVAEKLGGRIISFSNHFEAAEKVIDNLTFEEQAELVVEMLAEPAVHSFDLGQIDDDEPTTFKDIVGQLLGNLIADAVYKDEAIQARVASNLTTYDAMLDVLKERH